MEKIPQGSWLFKQPSAWLPIAISLASLAGIALYLAVFGLTRNQTGDEGAPSRVFQCAIAGELPIIAYFALKWLPRRPIPALLVLALQVAAWVTPMLTILWLESL